MNLNGIVSGAISAVNPQTLATVMVSTGSTSAPNAARTPTYRTVRGVPVQVQPMSYKDLMQTEGLNLNGTKRSIYVNGRVDGIVRSENKGGDLIILTGCANAGTWLVVQILEQWPDWVKCACVLQDIPARGANP